MVLDRSRGAPWAGALSENALVTPRSAACMGVQRPHTWTSDRGVGPTWHGGLDAPRWRES